MEQRRRARRTVAVALLALSSIRSGLSATAFEAVDPHMGTLVRIKLYADTPEQAQSAFRAAFAKIAQLDAILSDYRLDSELNRVCRLAVRKPMQVSADLYRVLEAAQRMAEYTGGAFDPTLGPLTHVWREARKSGSVPDQASIEQARVRCGYRMLHVTNGSVLLDQAGMELDLGAIAKGDAADQALDMITRMGIKSALVAASGDLAFSDPPPGTTGWKVQVDAADAILNLQNGAVSTSGDEEQHLDSGGKRYSHIIDRSTGMGLTRSLVVSVITKRGIDADALSTAMSVLLVSEPSRGLRQRLGLADPIESSGRFSMPLPEILGSNSGRPGHAPPSATVLYRLPK